MLNNVGLSIRSSPQPAIKGCPYSTTAEHNFFYDIKLISQLSELGGTFNDEMTKSSLSSFTSCPSFKPTSSRADWTNHHHIQTDQDSFVRCRRASRTSVYGHLHHTQYRGLHIFLVESPDALQRASETLWNHGMPDLQVFYVYTQQCIQIFGF